VLWLWEELQLPKQLAWWTGNEDDAEGAEALEKFPRYEL
jgi:hypothetical protein